MPLPTKDAATTLLHEHVKDEYQKHHALMVATAMEGYAILLNEDPLLWYLTGLLHGIDYEEHPLPRFRDEWRARTEDKSWAASRRQQDYTSSAATCDFRCPMGTRVSRPPLRCGPRLRRDHLRATRSVYAYRKMNPVRYGEMKAGSIRKKFKDPGFAAKIDRATIQLGCDKLGVPLDDHIANLIRFFHLLA